MNQPIINSNRGDQSEPEAWQRYAERLERVNGQLRRRLDAAIRKIDADNDLQAKMYEELREARDLRRRNDELEQQLDETRRHYRRQLLERGRELSEATSALGIILRELLAARENSEALRDALPSDLSEPGALAKAVRTLCNIAAGKSKATSKSAQPFPKRPSAQEIAGRISGALQILQDNGIELRPGPDLVDRR